MSIQSIERAFHILRIVSDHPDGVRIGAIAEISNLNISTVSRIVSTLEQLEAIRRLGPAGRVALGPGLLEMVAGAPWTERLAAIAQPHLQRLADATGEAVGLTRIEGPICHVFYQTTSSKFNVQVRDWTGGTFPLHVTSTGKLYMAQLDPTEVDAFLQSPLSKVASGTITSKRQMREELKEVQQQGFAWTIDELEDGLTSIAVPICDRHGSFLAGVYVSAPTYRLTDAGERDRLRDLTVRTGRDIRRQLEQLQFAAGRSERTLAGEQT